MNAVRRKWTFVVLKRSVVCTKKGINMKSAKIAKNEAYKG